MRKFLIQFAMIGLLIGQFGLSGCGAGTETGNPNCPALTIRHLDLATEQTAADQILDTLCTKLTECNDTLTLDDCQNGILTTNNIDTELGLSEGTFDSYQDLIASEEAGTIVADADAVLDCLEDLETLDCSEPVVQNAFDANEPDNFDSVEQIFSGTTDSCSLVFEADAAESPDC